MQPPVDLSALSDSPGVYQFYDADGRLLYVGKARSLRSRVRSYFGERPRDAKTDALVSKIARAETTVTNSEVEALLLEATLVRQYQPRYNVLLRDDKRFPLIKLTNEAFPRLLVVRRRTSDGARYFGPFVRASSMRATLRMIHHVFPLRTCAYDLIRPRYKVCLQYHIKRCWGPCEFEGLAERYDRMVDDVVRFLKGRSRELLSDLRERMRKSAGDLRFEEAAALRDQARAIEDVVSRRQVVVADDLGDRDLIAIARHGTDAVALVFKVRGGALVGRHHRLVRADEADAEAEIVRSLVMVHYEEDSEVPEEVLVPALEQEDAGPLVEHLSALRGSRVSVRVPARGEKAHLMAMAKRNAEVILSDLLRVREEKEEKVSPAVEALTEALSLARRADEIAAFDVSHTAGRETVGAMVWFSNGRPRRSSYRSFIVRGAAPGDDYAAMREVVERAFRRMLEEGSRPDLCLVDGGVGQLKAARSALETLALVDEIPHAALAKRLEEVYLPHAGEAVRLPASSVALLLLKRVRDEVHRRAVSHHRGRRGARLVGSALDGIPGVGPARRNVLLKRFGSVEGVKNATPEQLMETKGITKQVAHAIREHLEGHGDQDG